MFLKVKIRVNALSRANPISTKNETDYCINLSSVSMPLIGRFSFLRGTCQLIHMIH